MKISVVITSLNHATVIGRAIQSVTAQTGVELAEIVLRDAGSSDATITTYRRTVEQVSGRVAGRVELQGQSLAATAAACRGDLIAWLDAGDYWISPHKLARGAEYLRSHPDTGAVFHDAVSTAAEGERLVCGPAAAERVSLAELLFDNLIPQSTLLFRRELLTANPPLWAGDPLTQAWALNVLIAARTPFDYLADAMAVVHPVPAAVEDSTPRQQAAIRLLAEVDPFLQHKHTVLIQALTARWRTLAALEDAHAELRRQAGEWHRQLEQLRVERSSVVNESYGHIQKLSAQLQEAAASHATLTAEKQELTRALDARHQEIAALHADRAAQQKVTDSLDQTLRRFSDLSAALEQVRSLGGPIGATESQVRDISKRVESSGQRLSEVHRWLSVQRTRELVDAHVPEATTVVVFSKGDDELLRLGGRTAWHYPQQPDGSYRGWYPKDSEAALAELGDLRARGATYVVLPATALWWLDHYPGLRAHFEQCYRVVVQRPDTCVIFAATGASDCEVEDRAVAAHGAESSITSMAPAMVTGAARAGRSAEPVRVLYIAHNQMRVSPGGAEAHTAEVFEAMRRTPGVDAYLLSRTGPPVTPAEQRADRVQPIDGAPGEFSLYTNFTELDPFYLRITDAAYVRAVRTFVEELNPDVVHVQHTLGLGYDVLRIIRETLPDAPLLYTLHEYLPICHQLGQMTRPGSGELCDQATPQGCTKCFPQFQAEHFTERERFIKASFEHVDLFLAPSEFLRDRYVAWGLSPDRVHFMDYGRRAPATALAPGRHDRFAFFGQLGSHKGLHILLQAIDIVAARGVDARFTIHGANLERMPADYQNWIHQRLEAGAERVTFAGRYEPADIAARIAECGLVIVPSLWWENSPMVIQEAFLHGRPVICSDIGGMAEKVRDGVDGLHFAVGDPLSLANAICRAAASPELCAKLCDGIKPVYALDSQVEGLLDLYRPLMEARRPAVASV